jgi:hypothetical protein
MAKEILVKEQSNELIADLVKWATGKAAIDIRYVDLDDDCCAIITLYDYKGDNELSLRLHLNELYDVQIGYYDKNDDFIETAEPLTPEQTATLPEKLKKVMKKVLENESGLRLGGSLLA